MSKQIDDRYCAYCRREPKEVCPAEQPAGAGLVCTRPLGHTGPHVACGGKGMHQLAKWPNEPTASPDP